MARKNRTSTSTAIAKWDEELAKEAEIAAAIEKNTGGSFFGTRGGRLVWQESEMPNNEMAVIILDSIFENIYFPGRYDPDVPQPPTCFAFSREGEDDLKPHESVKKIGQNQSTSTCEVCEHNEWESAETGRGKACHNTRRLAMIPAGTFDENGDLELIEDEEHYASATAGFMRLPVTSVTGYANYVNRIKEALKRPPFGVITRVYIKPDPKKQFVVLFEPLEKVPYDLIGVIKDRRSEIMATIDFPYSLEKYGDEEEPKSRGRGRSSTRTKTRRSRKY